MPENSDDYTFSWLESSSCNTISPIQRSGFKHKEILNPRP